jgi:hypothetical protein
MSGERDELMRLVQDLPDDQVSLSVRSPINSGTSG